MRQIILDTETTGLEPELVHRIIETGCVELLHRWATGRDRAHVDRSYPRFAEIAEPPCEFISRAER
jgi:hypothetical protein